MAENKKSFVLYADLINVVRKLPDDKKGQLFTLILEYVNDLNPITDDLLLEIAFEPIKMQLKRDLKTWESIREKRAEAGKLGGRPKKQTKAKKANGFFDNQTKAKKAVTVTVNDTVNEINNNKAKAFFVADANLNEIEYRMYFFNVIKQKQSSRDVLFMQNKIDLSLRNDLWSDFMTNAIMESPQIENDNHAWNCFKRFVKENAKKYQEKKQSEFKGFE